MNYLAHFYLSFYDEHLLTGQFIADAVKGNSFRDYPEGVANGIVLHRFIDHYTDSHPIVQELRSQMRGDLKLLTSPCLDIFFDHILARDWISFHKTQGLKEFASGSYAVLMQHRSVMPLKMQMMLHYMSAHDWLSHYAELSGIERTFKGLSHRFSKGAGFLDAPKILETHIEIITDGFHAFFPQLVADSMTKMNTFAPTN